MTLISHMMIQIANYCSTHVFTCACAFRDIWRRKCPIKLPNPIIDGTTTTMTPVSLGDSINNDTTQPTTFT